MGKEIFIEEVLPKRWGALRSTVVRTRDRGYWVDTIQLEIEQRTHDTVVFEFTGYERIGKTAKVLDLVTSRDGYDNLWNSYDSFPNDSEAAKNYHDEVVELIAETLDSDTS